MKILILKGLPASGKSTYAKTLIAENPGKWKRVNKDDLRAMLDNSKWNKTNEKFVIEMRDAIVTFAMLSGYNVVVDDTNFDPKHEEALRNLAKQWEGMLCACLKDCPHKQPVEVEVKLFNVNPEECVARNKERNRKLRLAGLPVLVQDFVIWDMYNRYIKDNPEWPEVPPAPKTADPIVYTPPAGAPKAIICDIDGTLAHMTKEGRLRFGKQAPYSWHYVGEDALDEHVFDVLSRYKDITIIILSGRDGVCRPETEKWLADNNVHYDHLFMRTKDDNRKDNIIKQELFDQYIRDQYDVQFILDDRNQVVEMWRGMGLRCYQVAAGDF